MCQRNACPHLFCFSFYKQAFKVRHVFIIHIFVLSLEFGHKQNHFKCNIQSGEQKEVSQRSIRFLDVTTYLLLQ